MVAGMVVAMAAGMVAATTTIMAIVVQIMTIEAADLLIMVLHVLVIQDREEVQVVSVRDQAIIMEMVRLLVLALATQLEEEVLLQHVQIHVRAIMAHQQMVAEGL